MNPSLSMDEGMVSGTRVVRKWLRGALPWAILPNCFSSQAGSCEQRYRDQSAGEWITMSPGSPRMWNGPR
jgi:hypothetical protein